MPGLICRIARGLKEDATLTGRGGYLIGVLNSRRGRGTPFMTI